MTVTTQAETPATPTPTSGNDDLAATIGRIASEMANDWISPGDLAALRRARFESATDPAFWRLAMRHLEPAGLLRGEEDERRWLQILGGMAAMKGLHRKGARPGRVLAEAEVAEARVLRLLRAHGETLHPVLRAVVHQLASGGRAIDWTGLAELILSDGKPRWEEKARRRVARDYYRALGRRSVQTESEREG